MMFLDITLSYFYAGPVQALSLMESGWDKSPGATPGWRYLPN